LFPGSIGESSARQHDEAHKNEMTVGLQMNLAVEVALFFPVENH
jgi:hypothetical protein